MVLAASISACSTTEPAAPPAVVARPPPQARIGPLIELVHVRTSADRVKVIVDAAGHARVLVAAKELGQVLDVVLEQDAVKETRLIRSGTSPATIDAAFDAQGKLHALLDTEHWVFDDGAWKPEGRTPWADAGLKARTARFVPGAGHLIWSFAVDGAELGAPSRVDWYGFGGAMGAIIWPSFSHGTRAVVVAETPAGYGPWVVLEPEGKSDTEAFAMSADRHGKVHLVYGRSRPGLLADPQPTIEYVTVPAGRLAGRDAPIAGTAQATAGRLQILPLRGGHAWLSSPRGRGDFPQLVSADPDTGTALVGTRWIVRNLVWTPPIEWPFTATQVRLLPAGGDAFHAVLIGPPRDPWWGKGSPVRYALLSAGEWSGPLDLGLADEASFFGYIHDAVGIGAGPSNHLVVVWPMEHGIVGRRIELIR